MNPLDESAENFRKRYAHLHPLILYRSIERASDLMELFDILENIPPKFPIIWDENKRAWIKETDITGQKKLKNIRK